jgi:hypothetical protein
MDLAIELDPRHLAAWEARSRCQEHHGRLAEVPGAAGASLDSEFMENPKMAQHFRLVNYYYYLLLLLLTIDVIYYYFYY